MKIKLENDITMYDSAKIVEKFKHLIKEYSKIWSKNNKLMNIFIEDYMSIILKLNWAENLKSNKVYSLKIEDRKIVDEIFDALHQQDKMKWFIKATLFDYSIFVTWRTIYKDDKFIKKTMINIKKLNAIMKKNAYLMFSQTNIIAVVVEVKYIIVLDVLLYFYQWKMKSQNKHKQTIISHRDQKQFNVTIMKFIDSSVHVQK